MSVSFLWIFCTIWERRRNNLFRRIQGSSNGIRCNFRNFTSYFQQGDFKEHLSSSFFFRHLEVESCLWNLSKFLFVFSSLLSMTLSSLAAEENNDKEVRNKILFRSDIYFFKIISNINNIYGRKKLIMLYISNIFNDHIIYLRRKKIVS